MVEKITGIKVLSLHHDISTVHGEEVVLFTLAEAPGFREIILAFERSSWLSRDHKEVRSS
jgi:uncharacterized protein YbcI